MGKPSGGVPAQLDVSAMPGAPEWLRDDRKVQTAITMLAKGKDEIIIAAAIGVAHHLFKQGMIYSPALRRVRVAALEEGRLSLAQRTVTTYAEKAMQALVSIMDDDHASHSTRRAAANDILRYSGLGSAYQYRTEEALRENKPVSSNNSVDEVAARLQLIMADAAKAQSQRLSVAPPAPALPSPPPATPLTTTPTISAVSHAVRRESLGNDYDGSGILSDDDDDWLK